MNSKTVKILVLFLAQILSFQSFSQTDISIEKIENLIIENQLDSLSENDLAFLDTTKNHLTRIIQNKATYEDYNKLIKSVDNRPNTNHTALILYIDNIPEPADLSTFNVDYFNLKLYQIYSIRNELLDIQLSKDKYDELEKYVNQFKNEDPEIYKAKLQLDLQPIYIKTIEHNPDGKKLAEELLESAFELQDTALMIETLTVINHFVYDERDLMQYIANAEQAYMLESNLSEHTPMFEEVMIQLTNALSFAGGQEQKVYKLLKELYNYTPTRKASFSLFMQFIKDTGSESQYADSVLEFHKVNNLPQLSTLFIEDAKEHMDNNNLYHLYRESGLALQAFGFLNEAINYIDTSSNIYRTVYSEDLSQALANYDRGLLEKEKKAEIAIAAARTKFFQRLTFIVAFSALVVLVLLGFTYRNTILLRKQRNEISEQRDLIESQKEDKEVLLRELHHRVKNNFQIILSLLETQAHEIENEDYKQIIRDGGRRIKSMATVHDCLYDEEGLDINLSVYFKKLVQQLSFSLGENLQIDAILSVPAISVKMDTGILLGIIVNELITNSFKYGFNQDNPSLTLSVENKKHNQYELFYSDNGSKIKDVNLDHTGLGLALIKRLSRQLGGKLSFSKDRVGFIIDFQI